MCQHRHSHVDQRPFKAEGRGRRCYGDCSDVISARRKRARLWQKMAAAKRSVLSSLAVYAEDSDPESDSETGTAGSDGGTATGEGGEGPGESSGLTWSHFPAFLSERGRPRSFYLSFLIVCFLFFSSFALGEKGGLVSVGYGEDDFSRLDGDEEGYEEEDDENSRQSVSISQFLGLVLLAVMRCKAFCSWESP